MNKIRSLAARSAAVCAATLIFGHSIEATAASTLTSAVLDWSSFNYQTTDPGFAFISNDGSYGTTVTAFTQAFAPDFTTALSAGDSGNGLGATASRTSLNASINSAAGRGYAPRSADVSRTADFTLDNNSSVTFTINGTVSTNDAANPGSTSFAGLSVLGGDLGYYLSSLGLTANGSAQTSTGPLSFTVTNTSGAAMTAFLDVEGTANVASISAVPEESSVALMLSGLVFSGIFVARRRKS